MPHISGVSSIFTAMYFSDALIQSEAVAAKVFKAIHVQESKKAAHEKDKIVGERTACHEAEGVVKKSDLL